MRLKVEIECGNAAFDPDPVPEALRILSELAEEERLPPPSGELSLRDYNGNRVGRVYWTED